MLRVLRISLLLLLAASACKSWGKFWQTDIQYPSNSLLATQNVAMAPVTPTMPGAAKSCNVSPALPEGLSLASDCTISGTSSRGQGTLPYRVTADIGSDTVSGELRIRVLFQPRFVYVGNSGPGTISAFHIDSATGALSLIGSYGAGTGARYMVIHPSGKFAYLANTGSANISGYSIDQASGFLTNLPGSPYLSSANPYGITVDPQGRYLYVGHENAGVAAVTAYAIDSATGVLTAIAGSPFAVTAGSTPIAVQVSPDGNFLYVGSSQSGPNAHVFVINQTTGALSQIVGSPFTTINDAISVFVHPSGQFVYFAQYFSPTGVVSLSRESTSGALALLGGSPFAAGLAPGYVTGDVQGRFLFVENSGDAGGTAALSGFTVNSATGALTPISGSPFAAGANAIGFAIDETVRFAYAANNGADSVTAYAIHPSTGVLTQVTGSPYATGDAPFGIVVAGSNP
ncbi:MAG: hypothetical protein OHK0011_03230 [Turneriella sp.]